MPTIFISNSARTSSLVANRLILACLIATQWWLTGCQSVTESQTIQKSSYQYKNSEGETVTRTIEVKRDSPAPTVTREYETRPYQPPRNESTPIPPPQKLGVLAVLPEQPPASNEAAEERSSLHGSLELAMASGNVHLGAHVGLGLTDWWDARVGISGFFSKDTYTGFDLSTRAYVPLNGKIRPYGGLGVYLGESKSCYQERPGGGISIEVCDKKALSAGYVEAGFEVWMLSLFVRDYSITRAGLSVPTETFYGLGVTTRF